MKNGFTLVEILAVIAILAIVALITVPTIIGVFSSSKEKAALDSALGLKRAASSYYQESDLNSDIKFPFVATYNNGSVIYNTYVNNSCSKAVLGLNYSGQNPNGGQIYIDENGDVQMAIYDKASKACIVKALDGENVYVDKNKTRETCTLNRKTC